MVELQISVHLDTEEYQRQVDEAITDALEMFRGRLEMILRATTKVKTGGA